VNAIEDIMRTSPVIPVIVIDDIAHAVPIAEALVAVEGAIVGAGTVLSKADLDAAMEAGAEFIVSPGLTEPLGMAAVAADIPFLPGVASASDIMRGLDLGLSHFKFFPAVTSGGIAALKALAGPFANIRFCPTGGITAQTVPEWLALDPVLCVGGSWLLPKGSPDRTAIEAAARAAAGLR
jgi:2-dehydro-3-deoxyphosphogluconate aldolase/(4S)-4-hydroxy-2-oxoglutarate aldolase